MGAEQSRRPAPRTKKASGMRDYQPRPYAAQVLEHLRRCERANVHASPGMGKTSMILLHLDLQMLSRGNALPALVVAPQRVANTVWSDEVAQWSRFRGLRVAVASAARVRTVDGQRISAAEDRARIVLSGADIVTINYDNLAWLRELFRDRPWPFRTVIADESTRLKSHRCSIRRNAKGKEMMRVAGAVNAASLMTFAKQTRYWINLTGTPAPNGAGDLWGQQWPIDFGASLGRTHTAFEERWFVRPFGSSEFAKPQPREGALQEILEAIKPTTVSLDAYDWFDVDRPREIDVPLHMPPNLQAKYDRLHKDSLMGLDSGATLATLSKNANIMKCRQFAAGVVLDESGTRHPQHSIKLDAVEEIQENVGAPLLVAYWFQSDLDQLRTRFPKAVVMPGRQDAQQEVQRRWNEGKIDMLLVHPQSAGHGLNLQHGGHHLVLYTPDWNYEYYAQIIERIGPVRQAQAGYKRLVYVYRLKMEKTWDSAILNALSDKMNVDSLVRQAHAILPNRSTHREH